MSLPDLPKLEILFDTIDTDGDLWMRIAEEDVQMRIAKAVRAFREAPRSSNPADFAQTLKIVDAAIAEKDELKGIFKEMHFDSTSDADRAWFKGKASELDRIADLRVSMMHFPERGATPLDELKVIQRHALFVGRNITIDFEGRDGDAKYRMDYRVPDALNGSNSVRRFQDLANCLVHCEIPDWKAGAGARGFLRISGEQPVWLDAVDYKDDWLMERTVSLDALSELTWRDDSLDFEM